AGTLQPSYWKFKFLLLPLSILRGGPTEVIKSGGTVTLGSAGARPGEPSVPGDRPAGVSITLVQPHLPLTWVGGRVFRRFGAVTPETPVRGWVSDCSAASRSAPCMPPARRPSRARPASSARAE